MNADVLASIPNGTRVRILTHGGSWCKVQIGNLIGYMATQYLVFDGGNPHFDSKPNYGSKNASVGSSGANLRRAPSVNSGVITQLRFGTSVQVLGVGTEWVRVNANGVNGYIKADLLKLPAGASPHKTVVNNGSYVNLRSGAGYDYSVLRRVPHGSAATVVIPYEIWSKVIVKDGPGYLGGYMMNSFLK
jgi:mannosyl-glycoprotein endo-beta-N-acetylglucosaminidase